MPFAQGEMVGAALSGIDSKLERFQTRYLNEVFDRLPGVVGARLQGLSAKNRQSVIDTLGAVSNGIRGEITDTFNAYRREEHIDPVLNTVELMPKEELAAMAEALVNLTSFKRRITPEAETVGGPIDVAVISKGDGFVWIKRKHYFRPDLNPRFMARYIGSNGTDYDSGEHGEHETALD